MGKKDYQINVITADNIKNQDNSEVEGVAFSQTQSKEKPQDLKTGLMIGGLITFFLATCFMAFTLYFLFQTYNSVNNAQNAVTFVVFVLSVGWISYIPGAICSIISLCLNPYVIKSTSKAQKAVGIIFTLLSILMVLFYFAVAIFVVALPNS